MDVIDPLLVVVDIIHSAYRIGQSNCRVVSAVRRHECDFVSQKMHIYILVSLPCMNGNSLEGSHVGEHGLPWTLPTAGWRERSCCF
jgi:hypothetical protein